MEPTLGDFLGTLDAAGELHRVPVPVSPLLEISQIADCQCKLPCPSVSAHAARFDPTHYELGGKALLLEQVEGSDFPLCINVFGSYRRMEMALGCTDGGFGAIADRLAALSRPQPPRGLWELLSRGRQLLPLLRTPPRRVRRGACQEVVRLAQRGEVDLRRLPLIQCWPLDGDLAAVGWDLSPQEAGRVVPAAGVGDGADVSGRYVTFAGMHTIHADDADAARPASHNIGMYRAQLLDATHLVMHWHIHHDGAAHWRSWKRAGRPMPIAICFGGETVLPYAATAPLPPGMSELLMAGYLAGRGIPMVRAVTVPLRVPANSEIVIEGWVDTDCGVIDYVPKRRDGELAEPVGPGGVIEGPFGDHTGFYSLPDRYPLVTVTAVTHRRGAVFPATIVGRPPQEDYYLGKATERIFLPLLRMIIPEIEDYHLPLFGTFHNCAFIRISKFYPLQARRVMHALWGAGQMAWEKMIVVVDGDADVHDETAVLGAMFEHCDFKRDLELVEGPLDILDHSAARLAAGRKLGIDATRKIPGEDVRGVPVNGPPTGPASAGRVADALASLAGTGGVTGVALPGFGRGRCVFVGVEKTQAGQGLDAIERVWNAADAPVGDMVIAVDGKVDLEDWQRVLFLMCVHTDFERDLAWRDHRLGLDATSKLAGDARHGRPVRDYPPPIEMSDEIKARVSERWSEYGFA
ncbi:MAG: UbiD family decarboxylase domain-containing protein [Planctomycetota bacterium]|jgi:4-hydroxy-3-polyprenylbenzoate decarboxylase